MSKELVISASRHETKVALLEDGQLVEVSVEREKEYGLVGSIYKGRVTRVLPGMQSAFINIGLERDAFLYVSDFFEDPEEYEHILATAEEGPRPASDKTLPYSRPSPPEQQAQPEVGVSAAATPAVEAEPAVTKTPTVAVTPSAQVPERRPLGRRSHRGRYRGRRGGRGRAPGRFEARPYAPVRHAEPEANEPVILPGESLAKYKDRLPQPQRESPGVSVAGASEPAEPHSYTPAEKALPEVTAPPAPAESFSRRARTGEEVATPLPREERGPTIEPTPSVELQAPLEAARRRQLTDYIPIAEVDTEKVDSEVATASPAEPPEAYPEAPDDLGRREVRVEEENSAVALPPSVRERTAGGVEWERPARMRRRVRRPRPTGPSRRPRPRISDLLQPGQEIIVQIAKEQIGSKGARITSHVTLPGRYMVYMPTIEHIGVSRRIHSDQERSRLRRILLELKGSFSGGMVVRTAAEGASAEEIQRDLEYLVRLWRDMVRRAEQTSAPTLLHRDLGLMERILRDQLTPDFESLWVDNEEEYTKIAEFVSRFQPGLAARVKLYTKEEPIFEGLGIQQEIERALKPKVWLTSGGYIVINHTEALVAIDVNTGKFVGKGSTRLEDTIVRTNLDAVKEIVRQIRLRDLGGIIIIDFIDMEDRRNRQKVMQELERALRNDRSPSKMLAFNEFGLIAITRKRVRHSLEKVLCQPCPYCTGTGMVKSIPTLCYEIQAEAIKMGRTIEAPELTIRAHPEVAKALKARESGLLRELEEQTGKNIIVQPDQSLQFDQYTIF